MALAAWVSIREGDALTWKTQQRDAGRYLKALDQRGRRCTSCCRREPLRVALTRLLIELDGPPEESEHWTQLLDDLDQTSEVADMRGVFQRVVTLPRIVD